jgi:hypothetical protein
MKKVLSVFLFVFALSCGSQTYTGIVLPVATNAYFNLTMVGQTWQFVDSYNHHLWIDISQVPCAFGHCDANIIVKHYRKDSCAGYWNPRTPEQCAVATHLDELWFVLAEGYQGASGWIHDGAWRCIGFNYIDYLGVTHKIQVINQGQAPPYTIVPNVTGVPPYTYYVLKVNDNFTGNPATDFSPLTSINCCTTPWQTDGEFGAFTSPFAGTITGLISWQYEGCVAEHWYYKMNVGMVAIYPVVGLGNDGACISLDPGLAMIRVS